MCVYGGTYVTTFSRAGTPLCKGGGVRPQPFFGLAAYGKWADGKWAELYLRYDTALKCCVKGSVRLVTV